MDRGDTSGNRGNTIAALYDSLKTKTINILAILVDLQENGSQEDSRG